MLYTKININPKISYTYSVYRVYSGVMPTATTPEPTEASGYDIVGGFNLIAPRYDMVNDAMSFGLHRLWRARLCNSAKKLTPKGGSILDVATGTGEVIRGLIQSRPDLRVTGVDPSEGMLSIARAKVSQMPPNQAAQIQLELGDARQLDFPDSVFDTVTISWGIRNVRPFEQGLREMRRVLKVGGTLLVLESGQPENAFVRYGHQLYSRILPYIGGGLSGFKPAYEYYTRTAESFPCGRRFVDALRGHGFQKASYKGLMGGIVYLYTARK
jgi:demethylmenaquinone methyltransferase/2-methoxy-6-polyprenyl-1,4-benzoquinol methylase